MKKLFTAVILTTLAVSASAATYTVDDDGPADFNSIQPAVDFADDNDAVIVYPGIYYETVEIRDKSIILRSTDPNDPCTVADTIIDGNNLYRCILCHNFNGPNAVISGFTIRDSNTPNGGAMYLYLSPAIINNCTFTQNSGGAVYLNDSNSTIINCDFTQNTSTQSGGAILCEDSDPNVSSCNFVNNSASNGGAIASLYGSNPTISDCNFLSNTAGESGFLGWGGGLYCDASDTNTIVTNCTFTDNWADESGGGVCFFEGSNSKVTGCTFNENSAELDGGGAYCVYHSDNIFESCSFSKNFAKNGGAISFSHDVNGTIEYCSFSENHANSYGGAVHIDNSDLNLMMSSFVNNYAYYGGGVHNIGSPGKTTEIANSIFSGNSAHFGGGLRHRTEALLRLENCTFTGNSAFEKAGGMENSSQDSIVTNCIFWANTASDCPQIYDSAGQFFLEYSYCNVQGGWPGLGNISADPCFVQPGFWDSNGTPEDMNDDFWVNGDYHLKSEGWRWDSARQRWDWDDVTSRCIDAGNPGSLLGDELLSVPDDPNNEWGQNLRINMGAFGGTVEASIPPYDWALLADLTNDGIVDLTDFAYQAADWLNSADQQPGDLNRDGLIDTADLALLIEDWLAQTSWH